MGNKTIIDSLMEYDAKIHGTLRIMEHLYTDVIRPEQLTLQNQLFDSKFYDLYNDRMLLDSAVKKEPEVILMKKGKDDIAFQYYNCLYDYKKLNRNRVGQLKALRKRATNLIAMIKETYNI